MAEFIMKYWIEFVFSIVIAILGIAYKRILDMYKRDKATEKKTLTDGIKQEIAQELHEVTETLQEQITDNADKIDENSEMTNNIRRGVLSIQRREFERDCKRLLEEDHQITLEEFERISTDHEVYNDLGGNHNGDRLFGLVTKKVERHLNRE